MKDLEGIVTIITIVAMMLLSLIIFEMNCHEKNPYYVMDCSNNLLFHPKIIAIPSQ